MVIFPAERCTFRTADHLSELCKECSGEGKQVKNLKLKKSVGIISNIFGPHFSDDLRIHIGNSKCGLITA